MPASLRDHHPKIKPSLDSKTFLGSKANKLLLCSFQPRTQYSDHPSSPYSPFSAEPLLSFSEPQLSLLRRALALILRAQLSSSEPLLCFLRRALALILRAPAPIFRALALFSVEPLISSSEPQLSSFEPQLSPFLRAPALSSEL